ncbi:MAG: hypothetical protein AAFN11_08440, partial [Chloroflexota bacterium]
KRAVKPLIGLLDDETYHGFPGYRYCDFAYDALLQIGTSDALQACEAWLRAGNTPRPIDWVSSLE